MSPQTTGDSAPMAPFFVLASLILASFLVLPKRVNGAICTGYPWTVTATTRGGTSVRVHVCGTHTGCHPHDPRVSVVGNLISVTVTQAELPSCQCIQVVHD